MTKATNKKTTSPKARSRKPSGSITRKAEAVDAASANLLAERATWLRDLFPGAVNEGKVDFDQLREQLGDAVDAKPERYSFSWAGKRDAVQLLQVPSRATLVPMQEESVHFAESENVFIEGENLEVLKLLYKPLFGRVKMVYIDPPYNTGNDFVYRDDYSDPLDSYLRLTAQKDVEGNLLTSNPETSGRYHSAWLTMMYPRLFLARQLLTSDGVVFVSIDDNEVHHLRMLMNEVFGEENFLAQITVLTNPKGRVLQEHFARSHDYLIVYARSAGDVELSIEKSEEEIAKDYPEEDSEGRYRWLELRNTHRQFGRFNRPNLHYPFYVNVADGSVSIKKDAKHSHEVLPNWDDGFEGCWSWGRDKAQKQIHHLAGRKVGARWKIFRKGYVTAKKLQTIWNDKEFHTEKGQAAFDELIPGRVFQAPKPVGLIKKCIELGTNGDGDLVLDFFAGSGTTAQAVYELNLADGGSRRFVLVQLQEPLAEPIKAHGTELLTIADVAKERVRRAIGVLVKNSEGKLDIGNVATGDFGFRDFRLAESNYKRWTGVAEKDPDNYAKQMAWFEDPFVPGWEPTNVIWEVAIKEGYALTSRIEKAAGAKNNTVWRVTDDEKEQSFLITLTDELHLPAIQALALRRDDLFVCRDSALTDEAAANLALQCHLKTI